MKNITRGFLALIIALVVLLGLGGLTKSSYAAEASVSDWAEFKKAYEDPNITKIKLIGDVEQPLSTTPIPNTDTALDAKKSRTKSLEIDGSKENPIGDGDYYKLVLGDEILGVQNPSEKDSSGNFVNQVLHVHDLIVSNYNYLASNTKSGSIFGLADYTPTDKNCYTKYWTLKLGNIIVPKGKTERVARWTRGQVYIYGKNEVSTRGENFYLGGLEFEEGTSYFGDITVQNFSIIWWRQNPTPTDTGSGDFIVNDNCEVKLRNTNIGTGFPALYMFCSDVIIGKNSKFTVTVPGSAMKFMGDSQTFQAKENSVVTLTSLSNFTSMTDNSNLEEISLIGGGYNTGKKKFNAGYATNLNIIFEKNSSLYVIGSTRLATSPLIKLGASTLTKNNSFTIDSPKQFDIRNNGSTNTFYDAVQVSGVNTFNILNTNIALWKTKTDFSKAPSFEGTAVEKFSIGNQNTASGTDANLVSQFNTNKSTSRSNIARINGLNTQPSIEWQYRLSDADLNLKNLARVVIGEVPDDSGLDEDGHLTFEKQYADSGVPVVVTNNKDDETLNLTTDSDGYISTTRDDYYSPETILTAVATRGKYKSDETKSEKVFKITPPLPATVNSGKVFDTDEKLEGKNATVGAIVYVKVNGMLLDNSVTVGDNGEFSFSLNGLKLTSGDKVQIYLQDKTGKAPDNLKNGVPITNNETGNINPDETFTYSDATFIQATTYTVQQGKSAVAIEFQDEAGKTIDGYTLTVGDSDESDIQKQLYIGDIIDLTREPFTKVQDQIMKLKKAGYEVTQRPDKESEFVISSEKQTIVYKLKGLLTLKSAPSTINFGKITYNAKVQRVDDGTRNAQLVIQDTRVDKASWYLSARVSKQMTHKDNESILLEDSLHYSDGENEITLTNELTPIYSSSKEDKNQNTIDLSSSWGTTEDSSGIKLVVDPSKSDFTEGEYSGIIEWQLMNGAP